MVWFEVQDTVAQNAAVLASLASIEPSGRHSVTGGETAPIFSRV